MKGALQSVGFVVSLCLAFPSFAAPAWYLGYSLIYSDAGNVCSFMRFRADSFSVEQADILYRHLSDKLPEHTYPDAALLHTLPSEALERGESGEDMAAEVLSKGVGACVIADAPADGLLFVSAFPCDYQSQDQMCIRFYVDTGDTDASAQGIGRGPTAIGGLFIGREIWDASSGLVEAGALEVPFAVDAALEMAASAITMVSN